MAADPIQEFANRHLAPARADPRPDYDPPILRHDIDDVVASILARPPPVLTYDAPIGADLPAPWRLVANQQDVASFLDATNRNTPVNELAIAMAEAGAAGPDYQQGDRFTVSVVSRTYTRPFEGEWRPAQDDRHVGHRTYTLDGMPEMAIADDVNEATVGSDWEVIGTVRRVVEGMIVTNITAQQRALNQLIEDRQIRRRRRGAFFPYINDSPLDLRAQQIFTDFNTEMVMAQCLVYAAEQALSPAAAQRVKEIVKAREVSKKRLKEVADLARIHIELRSYVQLNGNNRARTEHYGNRELETLHLGLFEKHYFWNPKLEVCRFALKNVDECLETATAEQKDWRRFTKRDRGRLVAYAPKFKEVDALTAISILHEQGKFRPFTANQMCMVARGNEATPEVVAQATTRQVEFSEKEIGAVAGVVYFDFETDPTNAEGHRAYCASFSMAGSEEVRTVYGADCAKQLLEALTTAFSAHPSSEKVMLYAHNLGYDVTFLYQVPGVNVIRNLIAQGSRTFSVEIIYRSRIFTLRDSLAMLAMPLSKFPKTFNLPASKEVMPYNLYVIEQLEDDVVPIQAAIPHLKAGEEAQFRENVATCGAARPDNTFSKRAYAAFYCEQDVRILRDGFTAFREQVREQIGMEVHAYLSIASLAHAYMKREGCFEGVHELAGSVRVFIEQCVHGGRVMTAENKVWDVKVPLADYDANSLYPSAMKEMPGYPTGPPEPIPEDLLAGGQAALDAAYTAWFAEVEIRAPEGGELAELDFPLVIKIGDNGSLNYVNEAATMFVDNVYAEDLRQYQGAEVVPLRGYGFRGAPNPRIREVIEHCYATRHALKNEPVLGEDGVQLLKEDGTPMTRKNPAEQVWKLLMNSSYGKTAERAHESNLSIIKGQQKLNRFLNRNYENVLEVMPLSNQFSAVKVASETLQHFNQAHIGSLVLSWSKRIMNRVMYHAQDLGIKIFYQDTDSMHVPKDRLAELIASYSRIYGKNLDGDWLGQFSSDFEIKGCADATVFSERGIFLGKKVYIDRIVGTDAVGVQHVEHHIRMKGVSTGAVIARAEQLEITPVELYERMFAGQEIAFDLCDAPGGQSRPRFKKHTPTLITTLLEFPRVVSFAGERATYE